MSDGILTIDKPAGWTSHDVVGKLRKILKTKRIGHTGTLDPFATGVLVMLVGKATRLAQFLDKDIKEYEAVLRFGFETDTGDITGNPKSEVRSPKSVSIEQVENVLPEFTGEIEQIPPMYSAKKIEGKKLYELARKGVEIERNPIKVTIYELELHGSEPPAIAGGFTDEERIFRKNDSSLKPRDFRLRIVCSAGTYIRTLGEDIGRKIGVGAHLAELRRTRAGKFGLSRAVTIEELEKMVSENRLHEIFVSMNEAVSHLPQVVLSDEEINKTRNGMKIKKENLEVENGENVRMIDAKERLVAVGFYDKPEKAVQPKIVLV